MTLRFASANQGLVRAQVSSPSRPTPTPMISVRLPGFFRTTEPPFLPPWRAPANVEPAELFRHPGGLSAPPAWTPRLVVMGSSRDAVVRDIHRLMESGEELRELILDSRMGFETGLKMLEEGQSIETTLASLNTAARRVRMTELLSEFEERRHYLRLSITAAGLDEGMTIGDIGRAFGVSRQLASRFAKEARGGV